MQLQIAENWSVYNEDVWLQHPVPTMVELIKTHTAGNTMLHKFRVQIL